MIHKKEIPVEKIDIINKVLNNKYVLHSLNRGLWIAGGFARQIGHHLFFTDKNIKDSKHSKTFLKVNLSTNCIFKFKD